MKNSNFLFFILVVFVLQGCKSYTSNIILKAEPTDVNWKSSYEKAVIENPIKVGDKIQYSIYTNQGESIIDPSGTLMPSKSFGDDNDLQIEIFMSFIKGAFNTPPNNIIQYMRDKKIKDILK